MPAMAPMASAPMGGRMSFEDMMRHLGRSSGPGMVSPVEPSGGGVGMPPMPPRSYTPAFPSRAVGGTTGAGGYGYPVTGMPAASFPVAGMPGMDGERARMLLQHIMRGRMGR